MAAWLHGRANAAVLDKTSQGAACARLLDIVRTTHGIVLADEYSGLAPLAGKRVYFSPFEFMMLARENAWDERPFLASIASHRYAAILWYDPPSWAPIDGHSTPAPRSAIRASYRLRERVGNTLVMTPRDKARPPRHCRHHPR